MARSTSSGPASATSAKGLPDPGSMTANDLPYAAGTRSPPSTRYSIFIIPPYIDAGGEYGRQDHPEIIWPPPLAFLQDIVGLLYHVAVNQPPRYIFIQIKATPNKLFPVKLVM